MPGGNLREYIEENPNADEIGLVGVPSAVLTLHLPLS